MKNIFTNKWIAILTLLLLLGNIVTLTLLWTKNSMQDTVPSNVPPPLNAEKADVFLTRELQLTTEQQTQYRTLIVAHQAVAKPLQDSLQMAKELFFNLLKSSATTAAIMQNANDAIGRYEVLLNETKFDHFKQLRSICTPVQQIKFDEVIQTALRKMGNGKPPRPGGRTDRPPTEVPFNERLPDGPPRGAMPDAPPPQH
jgi:periplasmic protein CpxP/Spy